MEIKINYLESYQTTIVKQTVVIETDNYPDLEGMTKEEIEEYMNENIHDIYSDMGEMLYEKLFDQPIIDEKIKNNSFSIVVK